MYLDPNLTTCILEALAKLLGIRDHHVNVAVFVVGLASGKVVLGLIDTM